MRGEQYYKVRKDRREYHGDRYFKFSYDSYSTIQVCISAGDVKKGKGHSIGVYLIHRLTFLSNYLSMNYVVPCRKSEYDRKFKLAVKMLK